MREVRGWRGRGGDLPTATMPLTLKRSWMLFVGGILQNWMQRYERNWGVRKRDRRCSCTTFQW